MTHKLGDKVQQTPLQSAQHRNTFPQSLSRLVAMSYRYVGVGLFVAFLALYVRTAAPSVLSGDSAEFQFAAPLLGVAHPTTYPLYTLLGKLATLLIPVASVAQRVTLLSSACAALAVALFFLLARRVTGSTGPATVAALALGFAPGLWNAATIAEVYALLAALLAALGYLLASDFLTTTHSNKFIASRRLRLAAVVAGLGFTHHGLFVLTGLPLLVLYLAWALRTKLRATPRQAVKDCSILVLCFLVGMTPWLYPLIQYARFGPYNGIDWGLPDQ